VNGADAEGLRIGGLRADGLLETDLWIDQPDALERVAGREAAGEISADEAANLRHLILEGYCVFRPGIPSSILDAVNADADRVWREQPPYISYAYNSRLRRFSGRDAENRRPSCRIADLHSDSAATLALYLEPEIHRYIGLCFGAPPLATQSLYFEWGSQQALHRDPIHVQAERPADLLAAWIALEDIAADSGPLMYVPGSHRLPYFQFEPARYVHDFARDGEQGILAAQAWDDRQCRAAGLSAVPFLARRGEVLIWHHSLLHGGSVQTNPGRTRKSLVVHFTRRDRWREAANRYEDPWGPPVPMRYATRRLVELGGAVGCESPLLSRFREETTRLYGAGGPQLPERIHAMEASRFWKLRDAWFSLKRRVGRGDA